MDSCSIKHRIIDRYVSFVQVNRDLYDIDSPFYSSISVFKLFRAAHEFDALVYTKSHVDAAIERLVLGTKAHLALKLMNIMLLLFLSVLYYCIGYRRRSVLVGCDLDVKDLDCVRSNKRRIPIHFTTFRPRTFFISSIFLDIDGSVKYPVIAEFLFYLEANTVKLLYKLLRVEEVILRNSSSLGSYLIAHAARKSGVKVTVVAHGYISDFLFLTIFPCIVDNYIVWTKAQQVLLQEVIRGTPGAFDAGLIITALNRQIPRQIETCDSTVAEKQGTCAVIATQLYFDYDTKVINNAAYFGFLSKIQADVTIFLHPADRKNSNLREVLTETWPSLKFAHKSDSWADFDFLLISSISTMFDYGLLNVDAEKFILPYDNFPQLETSYIEITRTLENETKSY